MKSTWWICGWGHVFEYGQEDWHMEFSQVPTEPVPMYCQGDYDNGDPCMTSIHLYGPYASEAEATAEIPKMIEEGWGCPMTDITYKWRVTWFPPDKKDQTMTGTEAFCRRLFDNHLEDCPILERREVVPENWEMIENSLDEIYGIRFAP
jgi:hypothetical protein